MVPACLVKSDWPECAVAAAPLRAALVVAQVMDVAACYKVEPPVGEVHRGAVEPAPVGARNVRSAPHGLLSPEIVQRMDDMTTMRNERKTAEVTKFLDTYHQEGPMACLDMLSDPCILPKLTEAMRDIA